MYHITYHTMSVKENGTTVFYDEYNAVNSVVPPMYVIITKSPEKS